jgi:hypothetical protein
MYEDFAKQHFEKLKGTDNDYLVICRENNSTAGPYRDYGWSTIPYPPLWNTIEEAIRWHFEKGWQIVEIYDLYAEWHKAIIRSVEKADKQKRESF